MTTWWLAKCSCRFVEGFINSVLLMISRFMRRRSSLQYYAHLWNLYEWLFFLLFRLLCRRVSCGKCENRVCCMNCPENYPVKESTWLLCFNVASATLFCVRNEVNWRHEISTDFVMWSLLKEFKEGRRQYQQAPQVLYSHKEPPMELQNTDAKVGDNIGYITFGCYHYFCLYTGLVAVFAIC